MALLYGLCMGSLGVLVTAFWEYASPYSIGSMLERSGIFSHASDSISPATLIATPLALLVQFYALALYCHTLLWITKSKKQPFRATLRIVCYSQGASLFQMLPIVGVFFSGIAAIYLLVTGIHAGHELSRVKTFLILTLPIIVCIALVAAATVLVMAVVALSGAGRIDPFSFFRF